MNTYLKGIESPDPEVSANVPISLINVTSYLLAQQIITLEKEFLEEGGLRERMSQARIEVRKKMK
ncbi:MAG: four helix bundle suffix domain-containing protein [Paludibacter sp.]|nr:four helix bundle suffix domain-containing protein [Paludibacter sp.]